ncbi:MAG: bifunctional DNA-formamidopyrimidine glycosylase/DNA-(apurinic or apyrimidinic site) lyase [Hyphomicrobiaceae bacterium]
MPELPEVETVRRGLEPVMAGARIVRVTQRRPDLRFPLPDRFSARLQGRRIESIGRRAKYLLARLDRGETLLMHLGMTGRFSIIPASNGTASVPFSHDAISDGAHDHLVFEFEDGSTVIYNDPRRFGFMDLIADAGMETHKLLAGLGPEPLGNSFNAAYLASRAQGKSTDLKAFLLDQRIVAGLGNIYVCEALFRVGLSPKRGAGCLVTKGGRPTERCERLVPAIREVLEEAIAAGGSTLRDYRHTDGALGYFQHSFKVYGREGEPCTREGCQGIVGRIVQSGRSTFHCRTCQR